MLLIIGALAGMLLGWRFKVFVLVPATLFLTIVVIVAGVSRGSEPGMVALTVLGSVALLQAGYMVGCLQHAFILRTSPHRRRRPIDIPARQTTQPSG